MKGTPPEWSRMARLAGTVLRWVSRDHVEQLERWRTGTVEITGTTMVGNVSGYVCSETLRPLGATMGNASSVTRA